MSKRHRWRKPSDGTGSCKDCGMLRRKIGSAGMEYKKAGSAEWIPNPDFVLPCEPAAANPAGGKDKGGRPCLLTSAVQAKIVEEIEAGNYFSTATELAGIGKRTSGDWKARGEKDAEAGLDTKFSRFLLAVKEAEAKSEAHAVEKIRSAMPENWQAAMAYLERKFPERWGRRDRLKVEFSEAVEKEAAASVARMIVAFREDNPEVADAALEILKAQRERAKE